MEAFRRGVDAGSGISIGGVRIPPKPVVVEVPEVSRRLVSPRAAANQNASGNTSSVERAPEQQTASAPPSPTGSGGARQARKPRVRKRVRRRMVRRVRRPLKPGEVPRGFRGAQRADRSRGDLMRSSMPPNFGSDDPRERSSGFVTTKQLQEASALRKPEPQRHAAPSRELTAQQRASRELVQSLSRGGGLRSRRALLRGSIQLGDDETPYETQLKTDFNADFETKKREVVGSRGELMKTTMVLGTDAPSYETAASHDFVPRESAQRPPVKARADLLKTTMVLGTDEPSYETAASHDFIPRESKKAAAVSSRTHLMRSSMVLGTDEPSYETAAKHDFVPREVQKASAVSSRTQLMRSGLVLGQDPVNYRSAAMEQGQQTIRAYDILAKQRQQQRAEEDDEWIEEEYWVYDDEEGDWDEANN